MIKPLHQDGTNVLVVGCVIYRLALLARANKVRLLEHAQLMRHGGQRHAQLTCQLVDTLFTLQQRVQQRYPRLVTKYVVQRRDLLQLSLDGRRIVRTRAADGML